MYHCHLSQSNYHYSELKCWSYNLAGDWSYEHELTVEENSSTSQTRALMNKCQKVWNYGQLSLNLNSYLEIPQGLSCKNEFLGGGLLKGRGYSRRGLLQSLALSSKADIKYLHNFLNQLN